MANHERPLSPHLQVYKWQVQMVTSILNRITGIILTLGSLLIVWALVALAAGPQAWADFTGYARSGLGFVILFGWTWALAFHLLAGTRHMVQDLGMGYRVRTFVMTSWLSVIGSLVLTALVWIAAMMLRGDA
ncbi:MAG: succinate dehydrogenase, cytochrome b556 subunit [Pseudomonadota bacterium]|nr:succinate dehydrogenase, cytochrome b556 subunit [Pseudomonadota bacterium]